MATLAPKLPYLHPFAGGFPYRGSQRLPSDPDALTYLAAVAAADGAPVETAVAVAVDDFFRGIKADGTFSAIRSACLLCGARTLAGALVPLKNEGPELWAEQTPTIFTAQGSEGSYDAATLTMNSLVTSASAFTPRFIFDLGLVAGKTYTVTGRLSGDTTLVGTVRLGTSPLTYDSATGEISGSIPAINSSLVVYFDSTLGPASATIESLSIREVIAAPTNVNNNFIEADYNRETGLVGDGSTKYLDSGRAVNADDALDQHVSVYISAAGGGSWLGAATRSGEYTVLESGGLYCGTAIPVASSNTTTGFVGVTRDNNTFHAGRRNQQTLTANSSVAVKTETRTHPVFAYRGFAILGDYTSARLAFYSIGESISDLALLDARVTDLVTSIGAAI